MPTPKSVSESLEVGNSAKPAETVIVTADITDATMLKWDKEGFQLRFAHEKGSFKVLSDEVYKDLSLASKSAYSAIKPIAEQEARLDREAFKGIEFVRGPIIGASAQDRIHGVQLRKGLKPYFSHPGTIGKRAEQGYRIARPEDIVHTDCEKDDSGRAILRMPNGQVESILMVKDQELYDSDLAKRDAERSHLGEKVSEAKSEEVKSMTGAASPY
jgi:hypothetical protein